MLSKPIVRSGFGILIFALFFVLSCSEEKRHEMLTFFFDGVPVIGAEQEGDSSIESADPNAAPDPNSLRPRVIWYEHKVQADCATCHGEKERRGFSREVQLVAEVPELCYQCHEQFRPFSGHVHGPVAVGVCTYCHEPHRTRNQYLLKEPIPELCYQCHEAEVIEYFDSKHTDESYSNCTKCHDGHASESPGLLKKDWQGAVTR